MAKVHKDEHGLFVAAGGWKARPVIQTRFKEGDEVKTYHYAFTILAGVGKDETCKRGKYLERWTTAGVGLEEKKDYEAATIAWYRVEALTLHGQLFGFAKPTQKDQEIHDNYFAKYRRSKDGKADGGDRDPEDTV